MIVVDTNLIGYLFLNSPRSLQAEEILRREPHWVAPLLWRSELRNVLATQVRTGRMQLEDALTIAAQAEGLLQGCEYSVAGHSVLRLAAESGCTAYDCEFVALAQDLGVRLVTVDRQLLDSFPHLALSPDAFLSGPETSI